MSETTRSDVPASDGRIYSSTPVMADTPVMAEVVETAPNAVEPVEVPCRPREKRWRKRALLGAVLLVIMGSIFGATTERPTLLKPPDKVPSEFSDSIREVAERVDQDFERQAKELGLEVAPLAAWNQVARRLSLALVGNSLSLEEYRALEHLENRDRVTWWTEYLLSERRWADQFAERWTRATVGTNNGPFLIFRKRKYQHWLADQFEKNTRYDEIVRMLLTAQGSWTDAPEVNFLTATMDEEGRNRPDPVRLAGRTARAFLAMRIDCLQCHEDYLGNVKFTTQDADEPLRTGVQSDFHELAAFFANVRMDNPFQGLRDEQGEYRYRYLNESEESVVRPDVPFDATLCEIGRGDRSALADWVTHRENRAFARAAVNRVWAILFGRPLVRPIDDIPLDGPFPPGLEILADDFTAHGCDIQRLIRVIVATRTFQRDSRLDHGEPAEKHEDAWAVFPMTQLRPEQMAASIHQACRLKAIDASSSIISQLEMFGGVQDFTQAYGDRGEDEFEEEAVTIPQRLLMMNGSFLSGRINNNPIMNASTRIANLTSDNQTAIESAFLATLNRMPDDEERAMFESRLEGKRGGARSDALANMYWVLLNSTEFQWNH